MVVLRLLAFSALATGVFATPSSASDCERYPYQFIHRTMPDAPKGEIVARVQIGPLRKIDGISGESEGRIIEMLRGSYAGSKIIIKVHLHTSCDQFPYPGEQGIVVGNVISSTEEELTISAISTRSKELEN